MLSRNNNDEYTTITHETAALKNNYSTYILVGSELQLEMLEK